MEMVQAGDMYTSKVGRKKTVMVLDVLGDDVKVMDAAGRESTMLMKSLLGNHTLTAVNGTRSSAHEPLACRQTIAFATQFVTPEEAERWLLARHPLNRAVAPKVVARYADDIKAGRWRLTHQGIAFDDQEKLIDGQHRLSAIVRAGLGIWLVVARYVACDADAAKLACDVGRTRNIGCVGEVSGAFEKGHGQAIAAIVSGMMMLDKNDGQSSPQQVVEYYATHRAEIDWAIGALKGKEFNHAIRAAFAYAYASDPAAVASIAHAVVSKVGYADGSAAHVYVKHASEGAFRYNVRAGRPMIMAKVLRIIKAHVAGEKCPTKLYSTSDAAEWFEARRMKRSRAMAA